MQLSAVSAGQNCAFRDMIRDTVELMFSRVRVLSMGGDARKEPHAASS